MQPISHQDFRASLLKRRVGATTSEWDYDSIGGVRFITPMGPHCHPSKGTYLFFPDISALGSAQARFLNKS